jgi:hypothetical protein
VTGPQPAWGRALTIEQALFFAQQCRCFYCGDEFSGPQTKANRHKCWTRDHLLPAEQGHGKTKNIVLACGDCNTKKANVPATLDELSRATVVHVAALRLMKMFNGFTPPEWNGYREPDPTKRATEIAKRGS